MKRRSIVSKQRMRKRGYSRLGRDGKNVRLDALARSDLELRRQQLVQRQASAGVRYPGLERRLDAHAGRNAFAILAFVLLAQLGRASGRVRHRRNADRSREDSNAALRARCRERSHRSVACDVSHDAARRRPVEVRVDQRRTHRRHRQPAGRQEERVLLQAASGTKGESADGGWKAPNGTPAAGGKTGPSGRRRKAEKMSLPYALPQGEPAPGKYVRNETGATFGVAETAAR